MLLFRLPDGLTADGLRSVLFTVYLAADNGRGSDLRLDGLGLRSADEAAAISALGSEDYYVGVTPDPTPGVVEIDSQFLIRGAGSGYTYDYTSPALTEYVRAQVAAGGAGLHLALRLSAATGYGCETNACRGCNERSFLIARSTEVLTVTAAFSAGARSAPSSAPYVDGAALTALHTEELAAVVSGEDDQSESGPWLASPTGQALVVALLALLAAVACAATAVAVGAVHRYRPAFVRESLGHKTVPRTSYAEYSEAVSSSPQTGSQGTIPHKPFVAYAGAI